MRYVASNVTKDLVGETYIVVMSSLFLLNTPQASDLGLSPKMVAEALSLIPADFEASHIACHCRLTSEDRVG